MLVVYQKKGEKLHIGKDITISILDLQSNKVRLGIEAPAEYKILRGSLFEQQQKSLKNKKTPVSEEQLDLAI